MSLKVLNWSQAYKTWTHLSPMWLCTYANRETRATFGTVKGTDEHAALVLSVAKKLAWWLQHFCAPWFRSWIGKKWDSRTSFQNGMMYKVHLMLRLWFYTLWKTWWQMPTGPFLSQEWTVLGSGPSSYARTVVGQRSCLSENDCGGPRVHCIAATELGFK